MPVTRTRWLQRLGTPTVRTPVNVVEKACSPKKASVKMSKKPRTNIFKNMTDEQYRQMAEAEADHDISAGPEIITFCGPKAEECDCSCHKNKEMKHIMACCLKCEHCGRNIRSGALSEHEECCRKVQEALRRIANTQHLEGDDFDLKDLEDLKRKD